MKRYRRFNIIVTVVIFVGFTLLGIFVFQLSYYRSFEALIDLYGSFKYYFMNFIRDRNKRLSERNSAVESA